MRKRTVALLSVVFFGGMFAGESLADDPVTEYKVIHVKDEVEVPVTKTVHAPIPEDCHLLADYAQRVAKAGATFDTTSAELLDIISDLRVALAAQDPNSATALENRLRPLNSRTVGAAEHLGLYGDPIPELAEACTAP